jgi:hypothetical protein
MNLQAKASKLQVLVRADRQVSVSGDLQARLEQGQFTLRGDLTVDRASIILPEESAPSLDKDVVVRSAASRKAEEEERQRASNRPARSRPAPRRARCPTFSSSSTWAATLRCKALASPRDCWASLKCEVPATSAARPA